MKVWVIGRHYPALNNRMRGSFEIEQAKMLARGGYDVTYIAVVFHPYKKIRNWGFATWKEDGVRICSYSQAFFPERMNVQLNGFRKRIFCKALKETEKAHGLPDIIHIHYPAMTLGSEIVLDYINRGCGVVCTEHWSAVLNKTLSDSQIKRLKEYVSKADAFICVSNALAKAVSETTETNREIDIVPNVVENIFATKIHEKNKVFTYVVVGRLVQIKRVDRIIAAFARVQKIVDSKLLIVGNGEEYDSLRNMVSSQGLTGKVDFTGTVARQAVCDYLSKADCLICFSEIETFGATVMEAWACGIPAICSNTAGICSYWRPWLGYQVDPDRTEDLVQRMIDIVHDNYDKEKIAQYAHEQFSEEVVSKKIGLIYERVKYKGRQSGI